MEDAKRKTHTDVFVKRKWTYTITLGGVLILFLLAAHMTNYSLVGGLLAIPQALIWMAQNLIPSADSWTRLPTILNRLFETALVSVTVTVCAAICAFLFSLLGTRTMNVNVVVNKLVRMVAAIFRSIPEVVWAILLLFSVGQNILTGFFALYFTTFGMLTRAFIETIDEVSAAGVEALQATGAKPLQVVFQGIVPSSISIIISWVLYMIETNIRAATLIGILTGTGIGALFNLYYSRLDYGSAGLVVLMTAILVVAIETISNLIRKVIL